MGQPTAASPHGSRPAHQGQLDRRFVTPGPQAPASPPALTTAGNKKDNIAVIYTPWSNLKKDGSMDVGQVTFKDPRKVLPSKPVNGEGTPTTHRHPGQAHPSAPAREPHCQPPQQDQGGEEARPEAGKGRSPTGAAQARAGSAAATG